MKRGGRLRRTTALERETSLARSKPPRRKKGLASRRPKAKPTAEWELEAIAREAWHSAIVRRPCAMCKAFPVAANVRAAYTPELKHRQAHHIIAKRHLKTHGLHGRLWDSDNGLCLCEYHHARHERAIQRVPLALLPARARRFAEEIGLAWILDREYAT